MVEFVEISENFKSLITGGPAKSKPMQAGQKLTKIDGYRALSEFVNSKLVDGKFRWSDNEGKSRWEAYLSRYKTTRAQIIFQTGFGLTEKDEAQGIRTINDKENCMCPYYQRLDALVGTRQNVQPSVVAEVGISGVSDDFFNIPVVFPKKISQDANADESPGIDSNASFEESDDDFIERVTSCPKDPQHPIFLLLKRFFQNRMINWIRIFHLDRTIRNGLV
uniref:Myb/SANT-like domain-containing protein n=1 Tax=Spongospora subterranea TaxID=70186 RepID=A0A0H5R937_9EUKA|eukprot:CRZ04909.1 hypothetical protein [Spongospora subterranea]